MGFWEGWKRRRRVAALKSKAGRLRRMALDLWSDARVFSPDNQQAAGRVWLRLEEEAIALWRKAADLEINKENES